VAEHVKYFGPKNLRAKLQTADVLTGRYVACNSSHEQVTEALIKDDLNRNAGISTTQKCSEWLLPVRNFTNSTHVSIRRDRLSFRETPIPINQQFHGFLRSFRSLGC
jgi:hypothetical protein